MFLASAATKRPIAITCLLLALIGMGINSYRKMSIENIPAVDIPYVAIITQWVGASPEDIEKDVSKHIEDAVSGIDGLKHIDSSSLENVSQVVLEFQLATDVDVAAQDVRERIDAILSDLPENAERPVIWKVNLNASPVANIFLSGNAPLDDLYDYADNTIADRFASVPGVGEVSVIGGNEREVWVELDREKLAAAGLTTYDVAQVLSQGILSLPGGRIRDSGDEYSVRFDAEYDAIPAIAGLEVVSKNGMRLTLADLGTVRQATEEIRQRAILDGKPGVVIKVVKKAEANVVALVKEVHARFLDVQKELPGGMELTWVNDEAGFITSSFRNTVSSIGGAILLCAFILFVFLFNIRSALIVIITMPVTICISLFFMYMAGETLNIVTLLAIGLSTGVLVSNSIVVLENIVSKFETMDDHWEAANQGASEVAVAVLASAGTNVVVMFPIAMMTSLAGRMLSPFAVTTLIVNASSILISFTLTPILCAMLLQSTANRRKNFLTRLAKRWEYGFHLAGEHYVSGFLRPIARKRRISIPIIIAFILLVVFTFRFLAPRIGFTTMETADRGRAFVRVELPTYYDLNRTFERVKSIQDRLAKLPDLQHIMTSVGKAESMAGQANEGVYMGQIELFFVPKDQRNWKMDRMISQIRESLASESDCMISASVPSMMGGQSFQIEQNISGDNLDQLNAAALAIQTACHNLPGVDFLETTVRDTKPEIKVLPKRTVLADLGIPASLLGTIVRANIDGIEAANYKKGDRTYDIRVKLAEQSGKDQIRQFLLPGTAGRPIPLETVADVVDARSTVQIYRVDKRRTVKILGDIKPKASMSMVARNIANTIDAGNFLPPGCERRLAGTNEMLGEIVADFLEAIIMAIFLTLLTLAAILESWSRPALILLTIPMAVVGVLWGLFLFGFNISVMVLLGMLMLIGIVVNAAILIVDQTARHIAEGMPRREAMLASIVDQYRPVMMVVLASGLGMLPIALSRGLGSENRAGIGTASIFGILVAGALTLLIIPILYNLFTGKPKSTPQP